MTDRPVNEIRPGDRVYVSEGRAKGSIVTVDSIDYEEWITTFGYSVWKIDKPLRILQAGDVVPSGATYAWVGLDGKLAKSQVSSTTWTLQQVHVPPYVILSMPTSEPSREEQREKLVKAYQEAHQAYAEAVSRSDEAADALINFDAEDAS